MQRSPICVSRPSAETVSPMQTSLSLVTERETLRPLRGLSESTQDSAGHRGSSPYYSPYSWDHASTAPPCHMPVRLRPCYSPRDDKKYPCGVCGKCFSRYDLSSRLRLRAWATERSIFSGQAPWKPTCRPTLASDVSVQHRRSRRPEINDADTEGWISSICLSGERMLQEFHDQVQYAEALSVA